MKMIKGWTEEARAAARAARQKRAASKPNVPTSQGKSVYNNMWSKRLPYSAKGVPAKGSFNRAVERIKQKEWSKVREEKHPHEFGQKHIHEYKEPDTGRHVRLTYHEDSRPYHDKFDFEILEPGSRWRGKQTVKPIGTAPEQLVSAWTKTAKRVSRQALAGKFRGSK